MNIDEILNRLHVGQLNEMQQAAIRIFGEGDDIVLLSPTGSGKTLAYLLPLVSFLKSDVKGVQAVVLVPSRELALQIDQVFRSMGTGYDVMSCYGGRPAMEEHRVMKNMNPSVIIGTPGRMNDHLQKSNFDASTVRLLIIDEFDKCLEFGFQEEMSAVLGQLPCIERRFLLSATDAEEIPRFTGLGKVRKLDFLTLESSLSSRLHLYKVVSPLKDKLETLYRLLCCIGNHPLPEFVTLYIGKGKKDKINKVDIVGFLSKKGNLQKEEIGKVDVKEHHAFVAIARNKAKQVLKLVQNEKIKGIKTLIEVAK